MHIKSLVRSALSTVVAASAGFVLSPSPARAADPEVGQVAPDFTLPDQTGKMHHLADYRGKTVILAFYPKDMTAG